MGKQMRKAGLLMFLVAINIAISLACGGGGGSSSGTSAPLSQSSSPSGTTTPTLSPSVSPSPSPSPTTSPSTTPPPENFHIGDFKGSWYINPVSVKTAGAPEGGWYFNVDDAGDIVPEPDLSVLTYPRVVAGHIALTNATTGAFNAEITLHLDSLRLPEAVSFTGTLAANFRHMNATFDWGTTTIIQTAGIAGAAGKYTVERYKHLIPSREAAIVDVAVMEMSADGLFTFLHEEGIQGDWAIFREEFIYGSFDEDMGAAGVAAISFHLQRAAVRRKLDSAVQAPDLTGGYTVNGSEEVVETGDLKAYLLPSAQRLFSADALVHSWSIIEKEVGDEGYFQTPGFVMLAGGVIPAQLDDVLASTYTFDTATGYFTITINFDENGDGIADESSIIKGFLSPGGLYAAGTEFNTVNQERMGEMVLVNEDNNVLDHSNIPNFWSISQITTLNGTNDNMVFNFEIDADRHIINPLEGDQTVDFEIEGSMIMLGPNQYSLCCVLTYIDNQQVKVADITYWVVATLETAPYICTGSYFWAGKRSPDQEGLEESEETAILAVFDENIADNSFFAGTYDTGEGFSDMVFSYDLGSDSLTATITILTLPVTFDVVWIDRKLNLFRLEGNDPTGILGSVVFFFLPKDIAENAAVHTTMFTFADLLGGTKLTQ